VNEQFEERLWRTGRIEAFSDGVMAIAITLLVLDLHVPPVDEVAPGKLLQVLSRDWPSYVAYLAAYLTIGVIWLNHHALIDVIARFDRRLQWLNLMLLLGVVTLPFSTALMAEFVAHGGPDAAVATALYGALALLMALPWTFIWRHLRNRPELLEPGYDTMFADAALRRNFVGPLIYGAAAVVALVAPVVALVLYVAIALFFASVRQGGAARGAADQVRA
jgi:TMEM175 potassium channel family protein